MTLLAQRGLYAGPAETVNDELYARVLRGTVQRRRTGITLGAGTLVSGNAYFGRFPASYWQRWTAVREVRVEATVSGHGRVRLSASDLAGYARAVAARTVEADGRETVTLTAALDRFMDGGALWLDLETADGERLAVDDVRWTVAAPPRQRPTSVAFCTMNRPGYTLGILRALAADPLALDRLARVYVVDQGSVRVDSHDGYAEAAKGIGDKLRYLPQPNLGAAGGCNRGLYEVAGEPASGVLFLDDDVLLEPELVIRMTAFGDHAPQPIIVGGQMLNLLHPDVLLADAQQTDIDNLQPGVPMPHGRVDANLVTGDMQERRLDSGYNAWWACLMPIEAVERIGYFVPVFYQGDDAEYCYRARAHGIPTITLPGSGLWHSDFTHKDLDDVKLYFVRRNYLVVSALHGEFPVRRLVRKLRREQVHLLLAMQYGLAATLLRAVEDFLDGPDTLADGGVERLGEVLDMRSAYPETVCHPPTALPGIAPGAPSLVGCGAPPRRPGLFAAARTLDRLRGRHRYALGEVAHDEAYWWHLARFDTAVVTDASQEGVRVRRQDRRLMLALAGRAVRTLWRLRWRGVRARRAYRAALPVLSGRETWTRLYRLDG
jgi:galactofuranosylgalactofuranosylrhamnosyl-N-acetylglucosaminyl-diphospho-decaprenol beta-1,5/1,6-galactofuranosyltransferase